MNIDFFTKKDIHILLDVCTLIKVMIEPSPLDNELKTRNACRN